MPQQVVLITGASSGLGRAAAELLVRHSYRVFGTSRQPAPQPWPFPLLPLDVCCRESVQACVDEVVRQAGRIDVLINNAGYALVGPAEEAGDEQIRRQMDTNFFGMVRMVRAVLPLMRRQQGGRIVNVSSIAGQLGVPGQAYYCASKFALEGFSEALRFEVERFGIHVSLVEPGFFRTEIARHVVETDGPLPAYDAIRSAVRTALETAMRTAAPPERFARLVLRILAAPEPRLRYTVGHNSWLIPWCKALLPMGLLARGVRRWYRIGRRSSPSPARVRPAIQPHAPAEE